MMGWMTINRINPLQVDHGTCFSNTTFFLGAWAPPSSWKDTPGAQVFVLSTGADPTSMSCTEESETADILGLIIWWFAMLWTEFTYDGSITASKQYIYIYIFIIIIIIQYIIHKYTIGAHRYALLPWNFWKCFSVQKLNAVSDLQFLNHQP